MVESLQRLGIVIFITTLASPAFSAIEMNAPRLQPPELLIADQFSTSDVRFQSRGKDYVTYFTPSGLIVAGFNASQNGLEYFELGMQLLGAQKDVEITTLNPMLASNDQWLTNLPDYAKVKYASVYPGIDMICFGNTDQVEMQFMIGPGTNINKIRFRLTGSNRIESGSDGGLRLVSGTKTIKIPRPIGIQTDTSGVNRTIEARYIVNANNEISLRVGAFDPTRALAINP